MRNVLRRRAGEAVYAATDLPVALAAVILLAVTVGVGLLLTPLVVGVLMLGAGLLGARGWGRLERARAAALLGVRVAAPRPVTGLGEVRPGRWLRVVFGDAASWRAVAHLLLRAPLAAVNATGFVAVYGVAGLCLTYPLWFTRTHMSFGSYDVDTGPRAATTFVVGVAVLVVGPFVLAGPVAVCGWMARMLLGPSRVDGRVAALEQARGRAVDESAAALRRIERDLHDGTQARLVTLAMDLGLAKDLLDEAVPAAAAEADAAGAPDPAAVSAAGDGPAGAASSAASRAAAAQLRTAVEAAHRNARDAVVELRAVVANIHPPVLDTGLGPALRSLAAGLSIPVRVEVELPRRPPPAVETIVYFCAVELLGNVVKHSGARSAAVSVATAAGTEAGTEAGTAFGAAGGTDGAEWLLMRVTDNGRGGAAAPGDGPPARIPVRIPGQGGTGLAGLAGRVATVDGALLIDSPAGGPTTVTVRLPMSV